MSQVSLVVDSRETAVNKCLSKLGTPLIVEQLPVGDFVFRGADDELLAVFERKTASDLNTAIMNGRHRQQRQRLVDVKQRFPSCICGYILEGFDGKRFFYKHEESLKRVQGAVENMVVKHQLAVLPTFDVEQTAKTLTSLLGKVTRDTKSSLPVLECEAPLNARKVKIGDNIFYHQLMVVPHVGEKVAKVLADELGSAAKMLNMVQTSGLSSVSDIKIGRRKLGSKTAFNIVKAFQDGKLEM